MDKLETVSVVICTRNREGGLTKTLEYWKSVDKTNLLELIIVDNGSTDRTSSVISAAEQNSGLPIKMVHEPKPGLANARNAGIRTVSGEIVAFTDDDCYPDPSYVSQLHDVFHRHPDISFLGGRILLHDPSDLPITIKTLAESRPIPPFGAPRAGMIHGANMAIRRKALIEAGEFDKDFGAGAPLLSAEDSEMVARLCWCGFAGMYTPAPIVYHHHGRKSKLEADKLLHGYGVGRGAYFMKYLLKRTSRWTFIKFWLRELLREPGKNRLAEVKGAIEFLRVRRSKQ